MKKILLLLIPLMFLTGCIDSSNDNEVSWENYVGDSDWTLEIEDDEYLETKSVCVMLDIYSEMTMDNNTDGELRVELQRSQQSCSFSIVNEEGWVAGTIFGGIYSLQEEYSGYGYLDCTSNDFNSGYCIREMSIVYRVVEA